MQSHQIISYGIRQQGFRSWHILTYTDIWWQMNGQYDIPCQAASCCAAFWLWLLLAACQSHLIWLTVLYNKHWCTWQDGSKTFQNIGLTMSDMCLENVWKRGAKWCKHVPMDLRRNKASIFGFYKRTIAFAIRGYIDPSDKEGWKWLEKHGKTKASECQYMPVTYPSELTWTWCILYNLLNLAQTCSDYQSCIVLQKVST